MQMQVLCRVVLPATPQLQLGKPMAAASEGACCTFGPASPAPLPLGTAAACCASWGGPTSTSCFTKRCRSDTCGVAGVKGALSSAAQVQLKRTQCNCHHDSR